MYEQPHHIPHPAARLSFETDKINAQDVDEYFFRLVSKQIDALIVDGSELIGVHIVEHLDNKTVTRIVAESDTGEMHEFLYGSGTDEPVLRQIIDFPPASSE